MTNVPLASLITAVRADPAFEGPLDCVPYAEFLNLWVRRSGDELLAWLRYDGMLIGSPAPPRLHGGVVAATLEFAGLLQLLWEGCNAEAPVLQLAKPVDLTVEYLRGGRPQDVFAHANVVRQGRRIANVRAIAWQSDQSAPIAAASLHFLVAPS
ncbi:MAG: PaaI family thioesterase [Sphingomonadales bacterium]|nr:PaaI family thioesterase [Sphingomonadales bacterium]